MPMHRRKSVQFSWLCSLISFTPIINVATKYIKVWVILVYKGRGGIYRGIYVPLTLFGVPNFGDGGYREGRPLCVACVVLYAYAYCLDAIDIMTNTSDKYDWYESIVLPLIYHSERAYKGMVERGAGVENECHPLQTLGLFFKKMGRGRFIFLNPLLERWNFLHPKTQFFFYLF